MKRKLPLGVHFQIVCFTIKGVVFYIAPKIDLYLPSSITFRLPYNDIERIDFDFDIVTNVQVVECELPPPPNPHWLSYI